MLYFAYGMNTNLDQMASRCPRATSLGAAVLFDHVFEFRCHADVREEDGKTAVGVLWEITDECLEALDMLEGFPYYYNRKYATVASEEYGVVDALVYYMNEQDGLASPHDSYYEMVELGYAQHRVDTSVLEHASNEALLHELGETLL